MSTITKTNFSQINFRATIASTTIKDVLVHQVISLDFEWIHEL